MGWLLLIWRLVRGDIKRRRVQSLMLVVMVAATTATITLSLALQGVTDSPFAHTRTATKGPDVAGLFEPGFHGTAGTLEQFEALAHAPGVTDSSGPFPVTELELTYDGDRMRVHAEGRNRDQATLDQPLLTAGRWTTPGGVVVERNFADALGVRVGDTIHLGGRALTVRGVAVTSAMPTSDPLVWLNTSTLRALADPSEPLWSALNLKLSDSFTAEAFAAAHNTANAAWFFESWQGIRADDSTAVADERQLLVMGSVLLAILAVAGIAVMVGGRMAEQTRRVGLLKAVGATPRLVALVLMVENLLLAAVGTIAGLAVGRLIAPVLTNPGASLIGNAGAPTLSATTVGLVAALAAIVAMAATGPPALRGARTSTIRALNDPARPPQRHDGMIDLSARLPVPLLLGVRLIARRPRRTQLAIASVAIAVATFIATLMMRHTTVLGVKVAGNILAAAKQDSLDHVGNILSATLVLIAAINLLFTTWATVLDAQRPTALARALGATPGQITGGLASVQLLPGLIAAIIGIPVGLVLYLAAGGNPTQSSPPIFTMLAVIPATLLVIAILTAIPARIAANRPVAEVLRAE
ncbi:MAG TPA: FtsX-like permease family protein [Solirubrobacteraceae bacterium]